MFANVLLEAPNKLVYVEKFARGNYRGRRSTQNAHPVEGQPYGGALFYETLDVNQAILHPKLVLRYHILEKEQ
jgi:hypothetical protein